MIRYEGKGLLFLVVLLVVFCSQGLRGQTCVNNAVRQTYFIPYQEDLAQEMFLTLFPGINNGCFVSNCQNPAYDVYNITNPINKYVSINILAENTVIYYDQWEDGYEFDPTISITQPTTEIWGDGDPANGVAPGYPLDVFSKGDVIVLSMAINVPNTAGTVEKDAMDKLLSSNNILMTAATWATGPNTLLAGGTAVLSVDEYASDFTFPVGENADVYEMFDYVGAFIQAGSDNTVLSIDSNADGIYETMVTLNQGENYLINGGVLLGAKISASMPVATTLLTGDPCDLFEARFFKLSGDEMLYNSYVNPVSTPSSSETLIHLYNPSASAISVDWIAYGLGLQTPITVAAMSSAYVPVPNLTGSKFFSNDNFFALATIDSAPEVSAGCDDNGMSGNKTNDWGYTLLPESALTGQLLGSGWAAGQDPTATGSSENSSPIWVTPIYPQGSTFNGAITICIDYNGDGGALTDIFGNMYDQSLSLDEYESTKLYDSDGDQTGMSVWVCDGSDAKIAAVWGQDPNTASAGSPAIDVGTGLTNGIGFEAAKSSNIVFDANDDGLLNLNDIMEYCVCVKNVGKLAYPMDDINVIDTLDLNYAYVDNSTSYLYNGVEVDITDDGAPDSAYPLDVDGWDFPETFEVGETILVCYQTELISIPSEDVDFITNIACVTDEVATQKPMDNFELGCSIDIALANQTDCVLDAFSFTLDVSWTHAPESEMIEVTYLGSVQTITVTETTTSPQQVSFMGVADASMNNVVASFTNGGCIDTLNIISPAHCVARLDMTKVFVSKTQVEGNQYQIVYEIIVQNIGTGPTDYDLVDNPDYDDDITILSSNYTSTNGLTGMLDPSDTDWILATNANLASGSTDTYTVTVDVELGLTSTSSGDQEYSSCGGGSGADPAAGQGLFNQATLQELNGPFDEIMDTACVDLPYLLLDKMHLSSTQTTANCYDVVYQINVSNIGGAMGSYDLNDDPAFDDDFEVINVVYTSTATNNAGGMLPISTTYNLADDQEINAMSVDTYTITFGVCIEL